MTEKDFSAVAALELTGIPQHSFEDIVEEIDIAFRPIGTNRFSLAWDGDDIAILDRDSARILLGWVPPELGQTKFYLIVIVGTVPSVGDNRIDRDTCSFLKDIVLTHVTSYIDVASILHSDAEEPSDVALVDTVADFLQAYSASGEPLSPHYANDNCASWDCNADLARKPMPDLKSGPSGFGFGFADYPYDDPANDPEAFMNSEFNDVDSPEDISFPMRMTIYTLGATMLIYTPPVGASLLIYSTLRDLTSKDGAGAP